MSTVVQPTGKGGNRPAQKRQGETTTFRVRPGNTVTTVEEDAEGNRRTVIYSAGETVDLSAADAEAMSWAIEAGERRKSGQTSRLKRQIDLLKQQIEDQRRLMAASKDPELQKAAESMRERGDNYIAKGEPTPGGVPASVIDAHERQLQADDFGLDDGQDGAEEIDPDKLSGGMHGLGKEKAAQPGTPRMPPPATNPPATK